MIKIGITGGIGSGKSVVSELFGVYGIPVYIADEESKQLITRSPVIRNRLISLLGQEAYTGNELNRKYMAACIFTDPHLLEQVNAIIHPEVKQHYLAWVETQAAWCTALESAILFESGFDSAVDVKLMVYAPEELRIQRAMKRENTSREEVMRRVEKQLDDETKKLRSDYVIYNDGQQALVPQVEQFLRSIPT